jgi:hypothetical protein
MNDAPIGNLPISGVWNSMGSVLLSNGNDCYRPSWNLLGSSGGRSLIDRSEREFVPLATSNKTETEHYNGEK